MKTHQLSCYTTENLLEDVIEHAALSALVSRKICEVLLKELAHTSSRLNEEDAIVSAGDRFKIFLGGKIEASRIVLIP